MAFFSVFKLCLLSLIAGVRSDDNDQQHVDISLDLHIDIEKHPSKQAEREDITKGNTFQDQLEINEGETKAIACEPGKAIYIQEATYINNVTFTDACENIDAKSETSKNCSEKRQCSLTAAHNVFDQICTKPLCTAIAGSFLLDQHTCETIASIISISYTLNVSYTCRLKDLPIHVPCLRGRVDCGQPSAMPRTVGGTDATPGAWPWMVMLLYGKNFICGGSIISDRLILTAAHCVEGLLKPEWEIVAGRYSYDLTQVEAGQQSAKVLHVTMHGRYEYNNKFENDIALLVIDPPLTFTSKVKPICLPSASMGVTEGQECMAAGWGRTSSEPEPVIEPSTLQQVRLNVISDSTCSRSDWYGSGWYNFNPDKSICAGYAQGGEDTCKGISSGGPLVCKTGDRWFQQGITSWGENDPCASLKRPGVFVDVSKFTDWLQYTANITWFCNLPKDTQYTPPIGPIGPFHAIVG